MGINMAKAIWNGKVIAESNKVLLFDGNRYFPKESLNMMFFSPTKTTTRCFWKGVANYYTITVDGKKNVDGAWYYLEPSPQAVEIKEHVAFWKGVELVGF
jgi:uncharacterized protein (DUF427 family)